MIKIAVPNMMGNLIDRCMQAFGAAGNTVNMFEPRNLLRGIKS